MVADQRADHRRRDGTSRDYIEPAIRPLDLQKLDTDTVRDTQLKRGHTKKLRP